MSVRSLAYLRIAATDLDAWRQFGTHAMGAMVDEDDNGRLQIRIDGRPWRFRIEKGDADRLLASGFECLDESAFESCLEKLSGAGCDVTRASDEDAADRQVTALATFADPAGNPLELSHGGRTTGTPFVSPQGVSGFVTGDAGMGHVVLPAPGAFEECRAFYRDVLGFGVSDEMRVQVPDGPPNGLGMCFMHAAGPRHHAVAFGEFPSPTGCIHAMVEVNTLDEVGLALDRVNSVGHHLSSTLGRHTNDKMVSFYVRTPSGFDIEYGCGGEQTHDWSTFTPTFTIKEDLWGHTWDFGQ